ncbi:MAG: hypothetical protein ABII12_10250 [Planctomycetota bacterium]
MRNTWGPYCFLRIIALAGLTVLLGSTALVTGQSSPQPPSKPGEDTATSRPASTQPASAEEAPKDKDPAKTDGDPGPRREPTPSEILRELTKIGRGANRVVIPATDPSLPERKMVSTTALPANAIVPPTAKLLPDGYRLVDRPGRLAREDQYWVLSFESRGRGAPELPIRLLPNRLLEDMEVISAGGTKAVVFVISGEVTEYKGVNYLLLQKLLTRPDLGNLE